MASVPPDVSCRCQTLLQTERGRDRDRGGGCTKKSTPAAAEHWLSVCGRHWIRSDVPCRPHRSHSTRTSHRGSRRASNTELLKLDCITCSAFYWSPQFYTMTSKELSGLVFVKTPPFRLWLRTVYDCCYCGVVIHGSWSRTEFISDRPFCRH